MSYRERECRVFVGFVLKVFYLNIFIFRNLPPDIRQKDIEDIFAKYGKITYIDMKTRPIRGPPFAFVSVKFVINYLVNYLV